MLRLVNCLTRFIPNYTEILLPLITKLIRTNSSGNTIQEKNFQIRKRVEIYVSFEILQPG